MNDEILPTKVLVFAFFTATVLYANIIRMLRRDITSITNQRLYFQRQKIINTVSKSRYEAFEKIGSEKIYTCLNNDTETISAQISAFVSVFTSFTVLICCCVYLFIRNFKLTLIALFVICVVFLIQKLSIDKASKEWDFARDKQNTFYYYFNGLIRGFETLINKKVKINEFVNDINKSNEEYTKAKIKAELLYSYATFFIEGMIFFFIGFMVLIVPMLSSTFTFRQIAEFFVVFMMMKGHYDVLMNLLPSISKMRVCNKKIKELLNELEYIKMKQDSSFVENMKFESLKFQDIVYKYKQNSKFEIGPINLQINKGDIIFLCGGNGSGKTTIAKLLIGLYTPDAGRIFFNDIQIETDYLVNKFSYILSNVYLFHKMYGLKEMNKEDEESLKILIDSMGLADKMVIQNRYISDIKLSTGQKKRVALLLSYLERSDLYLFDEWAAEQDPVFKEFFYTKFLKKLKYEGKTIIVISHDEKYFHVADRIIKVDNGSIL